MSLNIFWFNAPSFGPYSLKFNLHDRHFFVLFALGKKPWFFFVHLRDIGDNSYFCTKNISGVFWGKKFFWGNLIFGLCFFVWPLTTFCCYIAASKWLCVKKKRRERERESRGVFFFVFFTIFVLHPCSTSSFECRRSTSQRGGSDPAIGEPI